jgi:hypothetical protein
MSGAAPQYSEGNGPNCEDVGSVGSSQPDLREKPLTWVLLAARLGVSVQTMKVWRQREGAPQVIDVEAWQAYVKKEGLGTRSGGQKPSSLRDEKTFHEIELLKARLARERRTVIPAEEVNTLLLHLSTQAKTILYQFLETEAPPKLDGMSAGQMRPILREMADTICARMGEAIAAFEER